MTRARRLVLLLGLTLFACSGSDGGGKETATPGGGGTTPPAADEGAEKERQLRAAQDHAVEALCERLYHCAVEDTPPEKRAEIKPEELEPKFRAECEDEGGRSQLSPRQVRIIQRCVNEAPSCQALNECLDEARKQ